MAKTIKDETKSDLCIASAIAFAFKYLNDYELNKIWEVVTMDKTFEKFFVMEVEKRVENKLKEIEIEKMKEAESKLKENRITTAKEMLTDGEPISKIKKYTKLTDDEIKNLQEELAC